jgi:alanine racemase
MRHSSFLEVNFRLLQENLTKISRLTSAEIIPMVKANAYGNGLVPISQFLSLDCQIQKLGCASLGEAIEVNQSCPELKSEMIVFSDTEILNADAHEAYQNFRISPVIHQREELDVFLKAEAFKQVPLVMKVNTGMNRLGLTLEEIKQVAPRLKGRGVDHLMTHFACSYYVSKEGDKTSRQLATFKEAQEILKSNGVEVRATSVANSGAIEQKIGVHETYVRPGLMLYGPFSVEPRIWDGHQISRLVTKVLKIFRVKKGTPVGYGVNVASEDGFMVVVPVGYGDGVLTFASGTVLKIKGMECKIFGRVNMDMTFLMFPPEAEGKFQMEERIELWNHDNRVISDIANQMKTHSYQLMCAISNRIPRIYKVN